MKRGICVAALLLVLACVAFARDPVDAVTTTDGRTYKQAQVLKVMGDKILLSHSDGTATISMKFLSDDTRTALGLPTHQQEKDEAVAQEKARTEHDETAQLASAGDIMTELNSPARRAFNRLMVSRSDWRLCPSCENITGPTNCPFCLCTGISLSSVNLPEPTAEEAKEIGELEESVRPGVRRVAACLVYAKRTGVYPWFGLHYRRPVGAYDISLPGEFIHNGGGQLGELILSDNERLLRDLHYLRVLWSPVLTRERKRLGIPDAYADEWASDCLLMGKAARDTVPTALKEVVAGTRTDSTIRTFFGNKMKSDVVERALREAPVTKSEEAGRRALGLDPQIPPSK